MDILNEITFRPFESGDYNFVLSNWAKTYKYSPWAGNVQNSRYHENMHYTFETLRKRGMVVTLACDISNPDFLFGFVAYEIAANGTYVLHYMYVKPDWQSEHGIARAMLEAIGLQGGFYFTHCTEDAKKIKGGKFVPVFARRKNLEPVRSLDVVAQRSTFSGGGPVP